MGIDILNRPQTGDFLEKDAEMLGCDADDFRQLVHGNHMLKTITDIIQNRPEPPGPIGVTQVSSGQDTTVQIEEQLIDEHRPVHSRKRRTLLDQPVGFLHMAVQQGRIGNRENSGLVENRVCEASVRYDNR